jgi:hypothetical protein
MTLVIAYSWSVRLYFWIIKPYTRLHGLPIGDTKHIIETPHYSYLLLQTNSLQNRSEKLSKSVNELADFIGSPIMWFFACGWDEMNAIYIVCTSFTMAFLLESPSDLDLRSLFVVPVVLIIVFNHYVDRLLRIRVKRVFDEMKIDPTH